MYSSSRIVLSPGDPGPPPVAPLVALVLDMVRSVARPLAGTASGATPMWVLKVFAVILLSFDMEFGFHFLTIVAKVLLRWG